MYEGLTKFLVRQTDDLYANKSRHLSMKMIRSIIRILKSIFKAVDIANWEEEINESWNDPVLGIHNPYSKITCLVIYLYSMELGYPPLYAELARVSRDLDF